MCSCAQDPCLDQRGASGSVHTNAAVTVFWIWRKCLPCIQTHLSEPPNTRQLLLVGGLETLLLCSRILCLSYGSSEMVEEFITQGAMETHLRLRLEWCFWEPVTLVPHSTTHGRRCSTFCFFRASCTAHAEPVSGTGTQETLTPSLTCQLYCPVAVP